MEYNSYAICVQACNIELISEFLNETKVLDFGVLVQILYEIGDKVAIKILKCEETQLKYSLDIFRCPDQNLQRISYEKYELLIAIPNEARRVFMLNDPMMSDFLKNLKIGQIVWVSGKHLGIILAVNIYIRCQLRFSGPVPEIGAGKFFGLFILDPCNAISPNGTLAPKYLNCDNQRGFILSADVFFPLNTINQNYNSPAMTLDQLPQLEDLSTDCRGVRNNFISVMSPASSTHNDKRPPQPLAATKPINLVTVSSSLSLPKRKIIQPPEKRRQSNVKFKPLTRTQAAGHSSAFPSNIATLLNQIRQLQDQLKGKNTNHAKKLDEPEMLIENKVIAEIKSYQQRKSAIISKTVLISSNVGGKKFEIERNRYIAKCESCKSFLRTHQGISLKSCHHFFCKTCLSAHINQNVDNTIKCPFQSETFHCRCVLDDGEIMALAKPEIYQRHCNRTANPPPTPSKPVQKTHRHRADTMILNCDKLNCPGWVEIILNADHKFFNCSVCQASICRFCEASHAGMTCRQFINKFGTTEQRELLLETDDIDWSCEYCSLINKKNQRMICVICGTKSTLYDIVTKAEDSVDGENVDEELEQREHVLETADIDWTCKRCTWNNKKNHGMICVICGTKSTHNDVVAKADDLELENQYEKLLNLDDDNNLIANTTKFGCSICFCEYQPGEGVRLRECLHEFCKNCLTEQIKQCLGATVTCPFYDESYSCDCVLQQREIRALVADDIFEKYLMRSLREVLSKLSDGFQCKTADCVGFWCHDEYIDVYRCKLCNKLNCHQCRAIHEGMNCREYQDRVFNERDPGAIQTKKVLEDLIKRGEAMNCPTCKVLITQHEGCAWIVCTMCKTEICWATKGPRWGPLGKGDTSGGCKCDYLNGRKCHVDCNYCH